MSKKFKNIFISGLILFVIIPLSLISLTIAYISRDDVTIQLDDENPQPTEKIINHLSKLPLGELYINSIDNDGVGNGLDMKLIDLFKNKIKIPIILAGGVGRPDHFLDGFNNPFVSAVSTAHLFNFVGNGLEITRGMLYEQGSNIAHWPSYKEFFNEIKSRKK